MEFVRYNFPVGPSRMCMKKWGFCWSLLFFKRTLKPPKWGSLFLLVTSRHQTLSIVTSSARNGTYTLGQLLLSLIAFFIAHIKRLCCSETTESHKKDWQEWQRACVQTYFNECQFSTPSAYWNQKCWNLQ